LRAVAHVPLETLASFVEGAVDVNVGPTWLAPWRIPYADRHLHHPMLVAMAACPAGVRLRFRTDSRRVLLETEHRVAPGFDVPYPSTYDLTVNGTLHATSERPAFEDLPAGEKLLELWLPLLPGVRIHALRVDERAEISPAPDERTRWVHYGSSISHCMEAGHPTGTWPAVAAARLGWHLTSLGLAGMAHLDPLVARIIAARPADRITLKVGINVHNGATLRERTFGPMVQGFLTTIRDGHPDTPITLISPILSPEREDSTTSVRTNLDGSEELLQGDLTLSAMREILADVVVRRNDPNLTYLDGRALFGEADLDHLPDGLHPDAEGYARMGARFAALA
jgi:hypothetical protein